MKAFQLVIAFLSLCLLSPVRLEAWSYASERFYQQDVPSLAQRYSSPDQADINRDGILEQLQLKDSRVEIYSAGKLTWKSPDGWQVVQASFSDLNHDGLPEVTLLVLRPFQPWPIDRYLPHGGRIQDFHNYNGMSCHLILIGWQQDAIHELWAGSALADPLQQFIAADLDGDGRQELLALERSYNDSSSAPSRAITAWEWNGFGFTLLARQPGRYRDLTVLRQGADNRIILLRR